MLAKEEAAMKRSMKVDFFGEAIEGVKQMGKITGRTVVQVVCDAFNTYEWILHEQASGKRIISTEPKNATEGEELEMLVRDKAAAQEYFDKLGR